MLTYLLLRSGIFISRILPLRVTASAAALIWRLGGHLSPRRRVVAKNLAIIARAGGRQARPSTVFAAYGRYWAELLHLAARPEAMSGLSIRVEGREHIVRAAARGPVCLLGAHLGNWDLLGRWASEELPGISFIAEELRPPALQTLFLDIRESLGMRILPAAGSGAQLYRRLRQGGHAGFLADRVFGMGTDAGAGMRELDFLGGTRRLPSAGVALAQRAGATLLPIFLLRERGGYAIKVTSDLAQFDDPLAVFAARLEAEIKEKPEQWCVLFPLHDGGCERKAKQERKLTAGAVKGAAAR